MSGLSVFTVIALAFYAGYSVSAGLGVGVFIVGVLLLGIAVNTGLFKTGADVRWNRDAYPEEYAKWKRSFLCLSCGVVTDPGIEPDYPAPEAG